jgi:hypothetical protein
VLYLTGGCSKGPCRTAALCSASPTSPVEGGVVTKCCVSKVETYRAESLPSRSLSCLRMC